MIVNTLKLILIICYIKRNRIEFAFAGFFNKYVLIF